jgi:small Trp-rich protein
LLDLAFIVTHCFIRIIVVDRGLDMWFLVMGLLFIALKVQAVSLVADWPWWGVLSPFGMAVLWWYWADHSGYTKRKVVEKENRRKAARIERQREDLGISRRGRK